MDADELIENVLAHHGVKGQKWGVRRQRLASGIKKAHTFVKDVQFEQRAESPDTSIELSTRANTKMKAVDLPKIKAKPEYQQARSTKHRLTHPLDPTTRKYRGEVKSAYINRLEEAANEMTNTSGTRKYTVTDHSGNLPKSSWRWEIRTTAVQHAAALVDSFMVNVTMDDDGFATDFVRTDSSLKQAEDLINNVLSHHGVKGQRWGIRREKTRTVTIETKRKNKTKAKGGEGLPIHNDAVAKVTVAQVKKKSGINAVSDNDLRAYANRLQLEAQVNRLESEQKSAGRRWVSKYLQNSGNQTASQASNEVSQSVGRAVGKAAVKKGAKVAVKTGVAAAIG